MSIGGETAFSKITRESFVRMANDCKFRPELVLTLIDEMLERITDTSKSLAAELNRQYPSPVYEAVCRIIERQASMLES